MFLNLLLLVQAESCENARFVSAQRAAIHNPVVGKCSEYPWVAVHQLPMAARPCINLVSVCSRACVNSVAGPRYGVQRWIAHMTTVCG